MNLIWARLFEQYKQLITLKTPLEQAFSELCCCYDNGGKLLLCGNGGSAADCEHIVGELLKEFKIKRTIDKNFEECLKKEGVSSDFTKNLYGALPAISLANQIGFISAFHNDANSDFVYAQQLYALGRKKDVLMALSTSGNSLNVINAAITAKAKGIKVISLTGKNGGYLKKYSDVLINVPSEDTARIQEFHLPIYHALCELLELHYFAEFPDIV